ncbi:LysR family transcriptional regulator [Lachnospiraceae bacterium ASD4241]|uniref:LysR family transcriptional regulator n=2 Tax=Diplocloster modestus TaxID=2850322 RepID=A0ABS6KAG6_9FIRM|nr:LysR family transcriptional regulator [Diplocloster modestus]MBU9727505.1 LysR family transcriptional regulator [Diplocloster modestus]
MTIRHLRIFQTVCTQGSITRAAQALYMTQPAVSHAISELEREAGCELFDRISRKIYLNETGKLFLEKVSRVLEMYDELENGARMLEEQAILRIGSNITIGYHWLPLIMEEFRTVCPDVPVQVSVAQAREITEQLLNHEIDLALIEGPIEQEALVRIPFSSYRLIPVCAPVCALAKRKAGLAEFLEYPLLLREQGSAIRDTFDSMLRIHNLTAKPAWTSVNSQVLIQAVEHNLGVSVLPDVLAESKIREGTMVQANVNKWSLANTNHLVYHKDKFLTAPMQSWIRVVKNMSERAD